MAEPLYLDDGEQPDDVTPGEVNWDGFTFEWEDGRLAVTAQYDNGNADIGFFLTDSQLAALRAYFTASDKEPSDG